MIRVNFGPISETVYKSRETGNIGHTRLENTEGAIKDGQSRETGNIGYRIVLF
jgi:hypothetical protein